MTDLAIRRKHLLAVAGTDGGHVIGIASLRDFDGMAFDYVLWLRTPNQSEFEAASRAVASSPRGAFLWRAPQPTFPPNPLCN